MWGFYNNRDRSLADKIFSYLIDPTISAKFNTPNEANKYLGDELFLKEYVYPLIKNNSISHDSYNCNQSAGKPFPSKRVGSCYIGRNSFLLLFF